MARRYEVNANQVFAWRKRFGAPADMAAPPRLVPVVMTAEPAPVVTRHLPDERIEIELPGGAVEPDANDGLPRGERHSKRLLAQVMQRSGHDRERSRTASHRAPLPNRRAALHAPA